MRKRWVLVALAAMVAAGLTACEDREEDPRTGTTVTEQTGPAVATTVPAP